MLHFDQFLIASYTLILYYNVTGEVVDHDFESLNITFPIGSTNVSFDIIINDDIFGDEKTFDISISSITNGHFVDTPGVTTITIVNNAGKYLINCLAINN